MKAGFETEDILPLTVQFGTLKQSTTKFNSLSIFIPERLWTDLQIIRTFTKIYSYPIS